jgi:hypothetical protein
MKMHYIFRYFMPISRVLLPGCVCLRGLTESRF